MAGGEIRKLFSSLGLYGVSNAIANASKFLLVPVYAHYLTVEQYGLLGTVRAFAMLLVPLAGLGIEKGVLREYFDYRANPHRLKVYLSTVLSFLLGINSVLIAMFALVSLTWGDWLDILIKAPVWPYGTVGLAIVTVTIFHSIYMILLQVSGHAAGYVKGQLSRLAISIGLSLALVIWGRMGALGVLLGDLAGLAGVTAVLAIVVGNRYIWRLEATAPVSVPQDPQPKYFDRDMLRGTLAYSLPFFAFELCSLLINSVDRLILAAYYTMTDVGPYTVCHQLSQGLRMVIVAMNLAYMPFFFKVAGEKDRSPEIFAEMAGVFTLILGVACLFGVLFSREILVILTPAAYHDAAIQFRFLLIGIFLFGLYNISVLPLLHMKKTKLPAIFGAAAGLSSLIINLYMVPRMGSLGAAISNMIANFILFSLTTRYSLNYYFIPYRAFQFTGPVVLLMVFALFFSSGSITLKTLYLAIGILFMSVCTLRQSLLRKGLSFMKG